MRGEMVDAFRLMRMLELMEQGGHREHRTYDNRGREQLDDVAVLCGDCHGAFHAARSLSR